MANQCSLLLPSIPSEQQRLRWGFPPQELRPSADPTHPVELCNGERVSVDVVAGRDGRVVGVERGEGMVEGERNRGEDEDSAKQREDDAESTRKGIYTCIYITEAYCVAEVYLYLCV